jgi:hypothetical protein
LPATHQHPIYYGRLGAGGEGIRLSPTSDRNLLAEIPMAAAASISGSPNTTGNSGITSRRVVGLAIIGFVPRLSRPEGPRWADLRVGQTQYSALVAAVIGSAVALTLIANAYGAQGC